MKTKKTNDSHLQTQTSSGFSEPLAKARQVAEFGIKHKTLSSKDVKQFGLKSMIANQVLRKYAKNKNIKRVTRVNLTIPNQGIKVDKSKRLISLPCLKFEFAYHFPNTFEKVNPLKSIVNMFCIRHRCQ